MNIKDLDYPIGFSNGEIGVSQSLLNAFMKCDYACLLYMNRYTKAGSEENFFYGSCCHEINDYVYTNCTEPPTKEYILNVLENFLKTENLIWLNHKKLEYYKSIIVSVMFVYFHHYVNDFNLQFVEVETIFNIKLPFGMRGTGKKDAIIYGRINEKKQLLLMEHKTKTQINESFIETFLKIDFQCLYYCYADEQKRKKYVDGVLYNVIRRPKSKPRYNETLLQFSERLTEEILKDPDHYFKRWIENYTLADHKEFKTELKNKLRDFKDLVTGKRAPVKNHASCNNGFPCEYYEACANKNCDTLTKKQPIKRSLPNGKTHNKAKTQKKERRKKRNEK